MSFWIRAMLAANRAVKAPVKATIRRVAVKGAPSCHPAVSRGKKRSARYTPAETIVAA